MVNAGTVDRIVWILANDAYGPGLTVADIRRRHPAKHVRRITILEALRQLEQLDLVRWADERVWWTGPILDGSRPLGIPAHRARRHQDTTPADRTAAWFRLQKVAKSMRP